MLRFLTAGESHGPGLTAIIEGLPAGLEVRAEAINQELARRQLGYGRGGRMRIEKDTVKILSGVRFGKTIGSPLALFIPNLDWPNWQKVMAVEPGDQPLKEDLVLTTPRPGHADLVGLLKTEQSDIRNVLERASARETAARVAVGALCKLLLKELNIDIVSQVRQIGSVTAKSSLPLPEDKEKIDASPVRCLDQQAAAAMMTAIDEAKNEGDTLGGIFEVVVYGAPAGLGHYTHWDKRLGANLAQAVMSIPAIKGIEIGDGFALAAKRGSQAHDEISYSPEKGYFRLSNHAGGLEGGMTNGQPIVIRAVMKPIPTLKQPLKTVDVVTEEVKEAFTERSDVCAVPAAAIIAEAMVAFALCQAVKEKFGGDSLKELKRNYQSYLEQISK